MNEEEAWALYNDLAMGNPSIEFKIVDTGRTPSRLKYLITDEAKQMLAVLIELNPDMLVIKAMDMIKEAIDRGNQAEERSACRV